MQKHDNKKGISKAENNVINDCTEQNKNDLRVNSIETGTDPHTVHTSNPPYMVYMT